MKLLKNCNRKPYQSHEEEDLE